MIDNYSEFRKSYLPVQKYSFEILQIQKYLVFQFQISGRWKKKHHRIL